ncbi:MAG TPA: NAD(P)H-hydrate dehydratase [Pyrinomonadaceae bacterium]|jgi:NAD(P)H-hydrate epimerase
MQKVLSAAEMREVDRLTIEKYGIPSILLMENAAHAAARAIAEKLGGTVEGKTFLILCGKGNNGGDGAALARVLWTQGALISCAHLFGKVEKAKGDAYVNFNILKKFDKQNTLKTNWVFVEEFEEKPEDLKKWQRQTHFESYDVIIDALFGTGLSRPVEEELKSIVIKRLISLKQRDWNESLIISLDLPSGLNADLAAPIGENVKADLTVTFTAPKPANVLAPASNFGGELVVANIGSPQELIDNSPSQLFLAEKEDVKIWLEKTKFTSDSHKTTRGRAIFVAGSRNMAGAAVLAANAAMRSGVGLIRVATAESAQNAVSSHAYPEVMVAGLPETEDGAISAEAFEKVGKLSEKMHVLSIGSGLSSNEETTRNFVRKTVENRKTPVVIDADGLNALAPFDLEGSNKYPLILTPHVGEMRKLLGNEKEDFKDRVKIVRDFAAKHRVILVLKGERSLIAAPDGRVVINPTGNSGLGRAGNGDTLAGIVTGFVAQAVAMKLDIFDSVVAALYVAGLAGDIAERKFGKRVMTASDVRDCLSSAFREIEEN